MHEDASFSHAPFRLAMLAILLAVKFLRWWIHRSDADAAPEVIDMRDAGMALFYIVPTEVVTWLYIAWPAALEWAAVPWPAEIRWLGLVPGFLAVSLFLWAHCSLGPDFSVFLRPREGHRLVTHGPYHHIRHPIYTSAFLLAATFALLSANALVAAVWLISVSVFFAWRIPREEAMMIARFNGPYLAYMKTTGALLPWFWRRDRPTFNRRS